MLTSKERKRIPKTDHPRRENVKTQPLNRGHVFNEPFVLTQGWYPVCPSKKLKQLMARSFSFLDQRVVVYRGQSNEVYAMDSFCPHMGADLGNGTVVGESLRCFFHQWKFSSRGECSQMPMGKTKCLQTYPVSEKYGFIWVFAGEKESHEVPEPPALRGNNVSSFFFRRVRLFAHHHVMMVNGIDLKHFKTVHGLDIEFKYKTQEVQPFVFQWDLMGKIPKKNLITRFAAWLTGGSFRYQALFAGGTYWSYQLWT